MELKGTVYVLNMPTGWRVYLECLKCVPSVPKLTFVYLDLYTKYIVANKVFDHVIVDISLKFLGPFSFIVVVDSCL